MVGVASSPGSRYHGGSTDLRQIYHFPIGLCDIPLHGTMGHAFIQSFTSRKVSQRGRQAARQRGSEGYPHPSLRSPRASVRLTRRAAPAPELTLSGRPRCPLLVEQRHHCSRSVRDVLLASEVAMRSCSRRGGSWASQVDTTRQASKSSKILPISQPEAWRARAEAPAQGHLASARACGSSTASRAGADRACRCSSAAWCSPFR